MYNPIRTWWLKHQAKVIAPYLQQIEGFRDVTNRNNLLIEAQRRELVKLREQEKSGQLCVEGVLKRGIDYYDSTKLPYAEQVTYRVNAEEVLRNPVFQNELRHLEADWVTFASKEAKDYEAVRDMRMCINAIELIRQHLAEVPDPRKKTEDSDPFDSV